MPEDPATPPQSPPEEGSADRKSALQRLAERRESRPQPVGPTARNFILIGGMMFCLLFGALTVAVTVEHGVDALILISFAILVIVLLGIAGAIRNPPSQ